MTGSRTEPEPDADAEPPVAVLVAVDRAAGAFEAAWRAGRRPRIEEHLDGVPEAVRAPLRDELIRVECELRRGAGEAPEAAEYHARFPDLGDRAAALVAGPGGDDATVTHDPDAPRGAAAASSGPPSPSRYELLGRIGEGGLGVVYRARCRDRLEPHELALKCVRDLAAPALADRFLAEMETMARLQHPAIVPILDSGRESGGPFFVMPFYSAGDLAGALRRRGPLPPATAAEYVLRVAWAVAYLHGKQVVHRDLKPSNILLDDVRDARLPLGRPHLADFGLVKILAGRAAPAAGPPGALEGTIPYMAPEQARGLDGDVGPPCDVWALGVLLFELVTGRRPFEGRSSDALRDAILHREPPVLADLRRGIPRDLQRIVRHCLEKEPAARYASAVALIEDLDAWLRGEPLVHAPPLGARERLERWVRRRPALATRWAVVAVLLANVWLDQAAIAAGWQPPGRTPPGMINLFWANQAVLVAWAAASWACQRRAEAPAGARRARVAWLAADVAALTFLLWSTPAP